MGIYRRDLVVLNLNDSELLERLRRSIHCERMVQSQFLAYLAEVETRRLYAMEGYSSLFRFVVEELGYSESSALKRIQIARKARSLPILYQFIEEGRISLTALSKLCPHLNDVNSEGLLLEAEGKSVSEVQKVIVKYFPKAEVQDRVRQTVSPLSVDRVQVTFSASTEFALKLEKLKARLSHRFPEGKLEEIFSEAMEVLQEHLDRKPREMAVTQKKSPIVTRHIPRFIRSQVGERDSHSCTYVSPSGRRCGETKFLELDHVFPWAWGGEHSADNLRVLCRAHNQLMRQQYFSRAVRPSVEPSASQ